MIIKEIKDKEDIKQAAELAELCFHELSIKNMEKFFNQVRDFYFIGAFEEDKLHAAAGFHKFQIYIREKLFNCTGIAAVMTHPVQRRKGYVKKLMIDLLNKSYTDGYEVSALWPFNHEFYRRFGYGSAERLIDYKIKPSNIKKIEFDDTITVSESKDEEDNQLLNKIASNALNKNTRIVGNFDAWYHRRSQKLKIYIFQRNNQPVGYITFRFEKLKDKEWSYNLRILDWAYNSIEIKKNIVSFLRNFDSDIKEIKISLPYDEEILAYLKEFNTSHSYADWPAMIRVINIKNLMEKLDFKDELKTTLYAYIKDDFIADNNGLWRFKIENGNCSADKINEEINNNLILNLTIDELSQIAVGATNVKSLTEIRNELVPDEWLNEQLFPTVPCGVGIWF